jgi:uncharacterized protein
MALPPPNEYSTVVVTGASSGIGAELARELSQRGHHVTLVARRTELLERLARELGGAEPIACDLADPGARAELIARLNGSSRAVCGVANNAGYGSSGRFAQLDLVDEAAQVRLNVEALHELTGAFLPGMLERCEGAILNVASVAGFQPLPGMATYAATKAFVISFSEALASELRGSGVSCTVLCPGPTKTDFSRIAGVGDFERAIGSTFASPAAVARAGVAAMVTGRRLAFPRRRDRALAIAGRFAPRGLELAAVRVTTIGALRAPFRG